MPCYQINQFQSFLPTTFRFGTTPSPMRTYLFPFISFSLVTVALLVLFDLSFICAAIKSLCYFSQLWPVSFLINVKSSEVNKSLSYFWPGILVLPEWNLHDNTPKNKSYDRKCKEIYMNV